MHATIAQPTADAAFTPAPPEQPHPLTFPVNTLDQRIAALKQAEAHWLASINRQDDVYAEKEGREVTDEDRRAYDEASDAQFEALEALTSYRPRDVGEMLAKAQALSEASTTSSRVGMDVDTGIYLADAAVLAQGLSFTAWDHAVEELQRTKADYDALPTTGTEATRPVEEAWLEADQAMLRTPAPHVRAAAEKLRNQLECEVSGYLGESIDDPRLISAWLGSCTPVDTINLIYLYQDLLRLAGIRPDVANAKPFDAAGLLAEVKAAGGELVFDEGEHHRPIARVEFSGAVDADLEARIAGLIPQEIVALVDAERQVEA